MQRKDNASVQATATARKVSTFQTFCSAHLITCLRPWLVLGPFDAGVTVNLLWSKSVVLGPELIFFEFQLWKCASTLKIGKTGSTWQWIYINTTLITWPWIYINTTLIRTWVCGTWSRVCFFLNFNSDFGSCASTLNLKLGSTCKSWSSKATWSWTCSAGSTAAAVEQTGHALFHGPWEVPYKILLCHNM